MNLAWTTEKSTNPGWYWWRHNRHVEPDILKVDVLGDKLVIYKDEDVLETPLGDWAGSLKPPVG